MPSTKSVLMAAAIAFSGTVTAHMIMVTPKPFELSNTGTENFPLDHFGADFPCKLGNAKFNVQGARDTMPQGSTQKLSFKGGATHGGGSCQVSLSADLQPTKNSQFKVIHSIIGGCPARNTPGNLGNEAGAADPDTYQFTIPKDLAAGDYTLAWTWFNHVGNQEMYMNCAPVTVTGGSGGSGNGTAKRDEGSLIDGPLLTKRAAGSLSSLSSAPDMFVANVNNGCLRPESGGDILFPNPGPSVEKLGSGPFVDPQPKGCGGSTGSNTGGSSSGLTGSNAGGSSSGSTGSNAGGSSSGPSSFASGSTATSVTALPNNTGGVFVPVASVASGAASSPSPTPSVASTVPFSPPVVAPSSGSSAPVNGSGSGSGSGGAQSGPCTAEGSFNCVGGTSFQQCASGAWSIVQPMASGTKCTPGQTQTLNIVARKRSVRFPRGHAHRRHNSYLDTY